MTRHKSTTETVEKSAILLEMPGEIINDCLLIEIN